MKKLSQKSGFNLALFAGFALALLTAQDIAGAAEAFPTRPINVIVPWGPGGMTDISARIVGNKLSEILRVPVVFINRPGATGTIGTEFVKNAKPDGYTLLAPSNTPLTQVPATNSSLAYNLSDFAVIGCFVTDPTLIVAKKNSPWKNLQSFVDDARKNPDKFNSGDGGLGGAGFLSVELIKQRYNLKVVPIHYKGSGELKVAVLGGVVDIASGNLSVLSSLVSSGEVTGLVVMTNRRSNVVPNVPTIVEAGMSDASLVVSNGLFAPKDTPKEIIQTLSDALDKVMKDPSVRAEIEKAGLVPDYYDGPTYAAMLAQELITVKKITEQSGSK